MSITPPFKKRFWIICSPLFTPSDKCSLAVISLSQNCSFRYDGKKRNSVQTKSLPLDCHPEAKFRTGETWIAEDFRKGGVERSERTRKLHGRFECKIAYAIWNEKVGSAIPNNPKNDLKATRGKAPQPELCERGGISRSGFSYGWKPDSEVWSCGCDSKATTKPSVEKIQDKCRFFIVSARNFTLLRISPKLFFYFDSPMEGPLFVRNFTPSWQRDGKCLFTPPVMPERMKNKTIIVLSCWIYFSILLVCDEDD